MTASAETQNGEAREEIQVTQGDAPYATRRSLLLFVAVVSVFVAARLWRLNASCLWFDEIFSIHASRHSWSGLIHFVAADVIHPPLFYALLKIWIGIGGESLLWVRLFAATTSMLTIVPFFFLSRELRLTQSELNLALLLMAINGYLIKYAQELRMYSLLLFFALCSLWLFVKFLNSPTNSRKQLLTLFVINLLLVYTHYSGWLLVGVEIIPLAMCRRGKLRPFLVALTALILAYTPWIYGVLVAAESGKGLGQNIGWVGRPRLQELAELFVVLNKPFLFSQSSADAQSNIWMAVFVLLLLGLPLLSFCWQACNPRMPDQMHRIRIVRWLFIFSFAPALLAFCLSWVMKYSIWGTRHMIIGAGTYSILVAMALQGLRRDWIRTTAFLILGCWSVVSGAVFLLRTPPVFIWCAWDQVANQMILVEPYSPAALPVYAHEDLIAYHLWFGLSAPENQRFRVVLVKGVPGVLDDPAYFLPRDFTEISTQDSSAPTDPRLWVAFRGKQWNDASPPLSWWREKDYRVNRVLSTTAQGQQAFLVELQRNQTANGPIQVWPK